MTTNLVAYRMAKWMPPMMKFLRFVMHEPNSGCWLWVGGTARFGYGNFKIDGKRYIAHRWSYEQVHGKIADGLVLRHKCDTSCCVNPDHLEPGTHADNVADTHRRKRNRQPFGYAKKNSLLTVAKVTEIKEALRDGAYESVAELGRRYGVTAGCIFEIRDGRNWKQVRVDGFDNC